MVNAFRVAMSATVIAIATLGLISTFILIATVARQTVNRNAWPVQYEITTLSPQSVNWLYATALICAVVICAVLL